MGPLLALALATAEYKIEPAAKHAYVMDAEFNGFLPILGGNEGKAEIRMGIAVEGESRTENELKISSEISAFSIKFNGAPLPLGLDAVQDFFPKATVTLNRQGKVLANTAPNTPLPVRLPGLDPRRMPDITFVPLEFSSDEVKPGLTWKFERDFSGAPLAYSCRVESVEGDVAALSIAVKQEFTALENEGLEVVKKEEDAVASVKTIMTGEGKVWFNLTGGYALGSEMQNLAVSTVTPLKQGKKSERRLTTRLNVARSGFTIPKTAAPKTSTDAPPSKAAAPAKPAPLQTGSAPLNQAIGFIQSGWDWAGQQIGSWWSSLQGWRFAAALAVSQIPMLGPSLAKGLIKG